MKPLTVNIPYPDLDGISQDIKSAYIISGAYATSHGELNATLQYVYHYFYFNRSGKKEIAKTVMQIALAEMEHLEILGELLLKLGFDPMFTRFPPYKSEFYSTCNVCYSKSVEKMLMDDISSELVGIEHYSQMLKNLENEKVGAIISRIILDEQLHVKVLKEQFHNLKNTSN